MQWETAIVRIRDDDDPLKYQRGSWDDREMFMVGGDWRHELEHLDESGLLEWFKLKSQDAND
jgi:hypothetical protein